MSVCLYVRIFSIQIFKRVGSITDKTWVQVFLKTPEKNTVVRAGPGGGGGGEEPPNIKDGGSFG